MSEMKSPFTLSILRFVMAGVVATFIQASAFGQTTDAGTAPAKATEAKAPSVADDPLFDGIYRKFYDSYRLGPADELSIRIKGQPDYSYEKVKISPTGTIYHMLLGEVSVGGLTITQVTERLTNDLSEYLKNPQVSVQLIEAVSAKIAVLGDVVRPDVYVMARPMSVLDAISQAGGFAETGSKSSVQVNRQMADGSRKILRVNVKNILEGKAKPEDNITLQAGDTVVVGGNMKKTIATITSLSGFGSFLSFISIGRR
ncbi:MAG: polysaccharide biosynthesis/export family protein [Blastocatellia bacterium]